MPEKDDASVKSKIIKPKKQSKKIRKAETEDYWIEFGRRYPVKMQEIHYLRETIKGKEWELKYYQLKLEKRSARAMAITTPIVKEI